MSPQPRSSLVRLRILFYALARLFLQKPERYHVRVEKTKEVPRPLFRLGESNAVIYESHRASRGLRLFA